MFTKKQRGLKKAKKIIEELSEKIANRDISLSEAKALYAMTLEEITLALPLSLKKIYTTEEKYLENRIEDGFEGMKNSIAHIKKIRESVKNDFKEITFAEENQENEFLTYFACINMLQEEFTKDVSDLLLGELIEFVTSYFDDTGVGLPWLEGYFVDFSNSDKYYGFRISIFESWIKVVGGYEVSDEIYFLKTPSKIRETKMSCKLNGCEDIKLLINA